MFNWCSYILEELLVAYDESQEKGITFTYGYLLVAIAMWKWKPPMGRKLAPMDKGLLEKLFELWHVRPDQESMEFNNITFAKWYTKLINTNQWWHIP
jgi:hypothetical protein